MEITRSRNKCFDDIANYLITMISLTLTVELYRQGHADRYAPNHQVKLDAKQVSKRLVISPHTLLDEVYAGRWPTTLVLVVDEELVEVPASASLGLGAFARPFYAFEQSMVVNYFERERPQIQARYGKTPRWPADWNFARIVRNSVVHNNEVFFHDLAASPVTWRGLTYAPADNGRKVLPEDLWAADLIYLMMDLDAHLR
jgi:hypothetical protein